ncbi:MAG: transposase [bacterium]|nr:transposase [bacterium]
MKQKRHTVDQIIAKLRRADALLGKSVNVPEICKKLEISEQTYYCWRQKYGGMQPEMAKELKSLQKENARLKKIVAEQTLDMEIQEHHAIYGVFASADFFTPGDCGGDTDSRRVGSEIMASIFLQVRFSFRRD